MGKDVFTYGTRLTKLKLPFQPLPPKWPTPSVAALLRNAPTSDPVDGRKLSADHRIAEAISLWNRAHLADYAEKQGAILVAGLLHFKPEQWNRHALALIEGFARGKSDRLLKAAKIDLQNSSAAYDAGEYVERLWNAQNFTNRDVLDGIFYRTERLSPSAACKMLLNLIRFARLDVPQESVYRDEEIAQRKRRVILCPEDFADEYEMYENIIYKPWFPFSNGSRFTVWEAMNTVRLRIADPAAFVQGYELTHPWTARWLAVEAHRKAAQGHSRPQKKKSSE